MAKKRNTEKQVQNIEYNSNEREKVSIFGIKRKPIISMYNGDLAARRYLGKQTYRNYGNVTSKDITSFLNGNYLDPYFKNIDGNLKDAAILSNTLYTTNRIYQNLIDYLVNMFYWRFVSTPRKIKKIAEKTDKQDYLKIYHRMIEVVDGFNIETIFPKILLEIFKNGQVFLYAYGDNSSKTMSMIVLPSEYCTPSVETQHGTTQVMFDFRFFDMLATNDQERELVFDLFPSDFKELYQVYKETNSNMLPLNPKFSTCIRLNNSGFPTFLSVFYELIDYKTYKMNELDRNTNTLERIIIQEIDLEKTGIELPEVVELHDSIADKVDGNGTTTITSVGKLDVKQIQEDLGQENKALTNAYKSIYDNAGFNYALFTDDSDESIKASIERDKTYVWNYIEQLVSFYNLAANNIYNFGDYQLSFRVLPISPYDESKKLELYRANATLGVGVVDLIVASGIKQADIESTLELEENLDLVYRLKPLQSSHVQSGTDNSSSTIEREDENEVLREQKDENGQGSVDEKVFSKG